jgi:hypothetical protein
MMKKTVYEKIPEFNQSHQMVVQLPPEEREDEIYYGVKIVDLPDEMTDLKSEEIISIK